MPVDVWKLKLKGRPVWRFFTEKGIENILPKLLEDLDVEVGGRRDEFARVLLRSIPGDILPVSFSVGEYEYDEEEESPTEVKAIRYCWGPGLEELGFDSKNLRSLSERTETVLLALMEEEREVGESIVEEIDGFRITYPRRQGKPTADDLCAVLEAFDETALEESTIRVSKSTKIEIDEESFSQEEEELEFFVERLKD